MITNVWATEHADPVCRRMVSRLVVEATLPVPHRIHAPGPGEVRIELAGCDLAMAPGTVAVNDGLLLDARICAGPPHPHVVVRLEHSPIWTAVESTGMPARLIVDFDRQPVRAVFAGRVVVVDAAHGGSDAGERGPVNLLEKNITLEIARLLATRLRLAGASAVMTRTSDEDVPASKRFELARAAVCDAFVSIHAFGARDRTVGGARTLCLPDAESERLAKSVQASLVTKLPVATRGVARCHLRPQLNPGTPCAFVEVATVTNWVEEGWFRSSTFKERAASAIMTGLKRYFSDRSERLAAGHHANPGTTPGNGTGAIPCGVARETPVAVDAVPIRTHVVSERERIVDVVQRYVKGIASPGDVIAIAESVVAITQGRAVLPASVRPGPLARVLCKLPGKDGSLATPPAMELALREAGVTKVLLGTVAAGMGRLVGRRGDFYRVAGRALAQIDDIAGTMPPYDKHVILGPAEPNEVAREVREATGVDAVIVDVNDLGCVDVLGSTIQGKLDWLVSALAYNPFGNDDQQTPIVVLKPHRA